MRNGGSVQQLRETGKRLARAREALDLSQVEICRAIGIGETTWNNWEKGKRRPDPIALVRFANTYGITLDYIYRGDTQGLTARILSKVIERRAG
jgi:transcriptional regulator with XRE-family HTH domain